MRTRVALLAAGLFLAAPGCARNRVYLDEETPVVVSEVHFDPSAEQGQVEFIEIANVSGQRVDLSGWQVTGAGRVSVPGGTAVGPGEAIVLTQDQAAFRETFRGAPVPAAVFPGKLKNSGEVIRVEDPAGQIADEVSYDATFPEVEKAKGTGLSLHRAGFSEDPAATWHASEPTPGVYRGR